MPANPRSEKRCNLPGVFRSHAIQDGAWRLSRSDPVAIDIFVRAAAAAATEVLSAHGVCDVDIEWRPESVLLSMTSAGQRKTLSARSAIVHEPLNDLYAALPLAGFDANTRRFWRRVFRWVRIPGGRHLIALLARRPRHRP